MSSEQWFVIEDILWYHREINFEDHREIIANHLREMICLEMTLGYITERLILLGATRNICNLSHRKDTWLYKGDINFEDQREIILKWFG